MYHEQPSVANAINTVVDTLPSTNDHLRALLNQGVPHGTWISARVQSAGRGRTGRRWISEPGNLYLSVLLRLERPEFLTWISLLSAVVCARAIQQLGDARVRLKWPNDLWVKEHDEWRKVGGILCEGQSQAGNALVILGIGINCSSAPQNTPLPTAVLSNVAVDALREALVRELPRAAKHLDAVSITALKQEFEKLSVTPAGTAILFSSRQEAGEDGRVDSLPGRVLYLGEQGELWIWDETLNEKRALYSEEVSLRLLEQV